MYWRLALAHAPERGDDVARAGDGAGEVEADVVLALDSDRREADRVLALHRLRGARAQRRVISRRLVPVLNEPLLWLGSEAHACLAQLDDSLALGIDGNGLIAASPEPEDSLTRDADGQRHCPVIGPVEALPHAGVLRRRLAAPPPWLCAPPHGGAVFALRYDKHDGGRSFIRRIYVGDDCTIGAGSFTVRLPKQTKVSVDVRVRDGHVVIAKGYAGKAPTKNGERVPVQGAVIEPGDVVGIAPFDLVLVDVVPPRPDGVDVADASTHGVSLASYPHTLALGQARPFTSTIAGGAERRGHYVNIGSNRVAVVTETERAEIMRVGVDDVVDIDPADGPFARPR